MGEVVVSVKQSYIEDKWQDMSQGGPTNHNARNISSVERWDTLQMILTFMYYYPHLRFADTFELCNFEINQLILLPIGGT